MLIARGLRRIWPVIAGLLMATLLSCASQTRPPASSAAPPRQQEKAPVAEATSGGPTAQVVLYAREDQPSGLPIRWVIRKIALDKADGSQISVSNADVTLATSDLELGAGGTTAQKLVTIADVPEGAYTGVTLFTRSVYFEDSGQAIMTDQNFITADYAFPVVAGVARTLTAVLDLAPPGAIRTDFKFAPHLTIEGEPPAIKGKLILVANEASSNLSLIDRSLKRVIKNVYLGTRPAALSADPRRSRLYITDRKASVLYEMDMTNQHLLRATQLDFTDEPVHVEPVPSKDLLIVVNFGSDTVYLVDAFNFQVTDTISVRDGPVDAVYSEYANRAFVVNHLDNSISVIDLGQTPAVVDTTIQVELRPVGITIDDSMGWLYVTNSGSPDLSVLKVDPKTLTIALERTITIGIGAGDIVLDPYGRRLFVAMRETNEILCLDPYTGVTVYSVRLPAKPGTLMFDQDEKKVYATVPSKNAVVVIDAITREVQNWIETGYNPSAIALRP